MVCASREILSEIADSSYESGERCVVNLPRFRNRRHALAQMCVEMGGDPATDQRNHRHGKRIEDAISKGGQKSNLVDEAQRGKARLCDQGTDPLAAGDLRFHPSIRKSAEAGEHFELEELRILKTQLSGHLAQCWSLRLAAHAAHAQACIDCR